MRLVFVGAGSLTVRTARTLLDRGHEVVIVERDKERLEALSGTLDGGFLCGDGTRPVVLREAGPKETDALLCLTGNDQTNIIASLVGRSLGFPRVVTRIEDEEFEHICIELGLLESVIPVRAIGRFLADMLEGQGALELSSIIKGDARAFLFVARDEDAGPVRDLRLPERARVVHLYRDGAFQLADLDTRLEQGDEVVVITDRRHLDALRARWVGP
jgi:trk/ktr system potassium uptake protein